MKASINLMQVLEKDLAIFGFFIALGRSTQSFLSANGFDVLDDSLGSFIRYIKDMVSKNMVLAFMFWLCICLLVLMQVPYRGERLILSSPFINKFLSIIRGG